MDKLKKLTAREAGHVSEYARGDLAGLRVSVSDYRKVHKRLGIRVSIFRKGRGGYNSVFSKMTSQRARILGEALLEAADIMDELADTEPQYHKHVDTEPQP